MITLAMVFSFGMGVACGCIACKFDVRYHADAARQYAEAYHDAIVGWAKTRKKLARVMRDLRNGDEWKYK